METLASIFSPPLLAVCAGLGLVLGALLFFVYRRGASGSLMLQAPLSWTEPIEVRLVLYSLFASASATVALLFRLIYMVPSPGSRMAGFLLFLTAVASLLMVGFFYATAGTLLQAALGARGRPQYWFTKYLGTLDQSIMTAGDWIGRLILRPAPVQRQWYGASAVDEHPDDRAEVVDEPRKPRPVARSRRTAQDIARERLDAALAAYEASLTADQLDKLRYMRMVTEQLKQSA